MINETQMALKRTPSEVLLLLLCSNVFSVQGGNTNAKAVNELVFGEILVLAQTSTSRPYGPFEGSTFRMCRWL